MVMADTAVDIAVISKAVELACRAPSLHNSQPWRWTASGTAVDLHADAHRVVRSHDSSGREALISCGVVLDHFRTAMVRRLEHHRRAVSQPGQTQFSSPERRTTVQFVGPLSVVDAGLADHAEAVVREAVSNAVRHANATTLTVNVKVDDDLTIEVVDNGPGISGDITGSGLTNLRRRAEDVGGAFTVENVASGGTLVRWSAPLP